MDLRAFVLAIILASAFAQRENADAAESCNVVCNCNSGQSTETSRPTQHHQLTNQGPPGKLGPKGDIGRDGAKGEKGDAGFKGQKGEKGEAISLTDVLEALSVRSCQDLYARFGVSGAGYYQVKEPSSASPVYKYCNFRKYPDVTTCEQLVQRYNLSISGYYLFGQNVNQGIFRFCSSTYGPGIYTCQALQNLHPEVLASGSGPYTFRSKSQGRTFSVYCNFSQSPAVTEIHHNMTGEIEIEESCEANGCFTATPRYEVNGSDLNRIIENSASCKQFLKLRCNGVMIKRDAQRAYWVSKSGEKMLYWGGATTDNYCACGQSNSCIDTSHKCNCDQNSDSVTTSDEGYLTDKTKLPLREIRVGDMGGSAEAAWYTIGKLECSGQV